MKIFSWNVNGMRAVLKKGFADWFGHANPDVLCLQEVRAHPTDMAEDLALPKEYQAFWHPAQKKGYSGVATITRVPPREVYPLGVDIIDAEGRVQLLEYEAFTLINTYFPNSQPERARIDYKLMFCDEICKLCSALFKRERHFVLCGDLNIAHKPIDLARPDDNEESPGYLPEERACMDRFVSLGLIDTFRHFHPEPECYSYWSYRGRSRERNVGWRLDYHLVDKPFLSNVKSASIADDVMGSDHCPVVLEIGT